MTGPSAASAGGRRVVLPAPGAAVTTAARERRIDSRIVSTWRVDREQDQSHARPELKSK